MEEQIDLATDTATTALETGSSTIITTDASPEVIQNIMELTTQSIYLMGASFVLGSLFTLFLLLVLDFIRRDKTGGDL